MSDRDERRKAADVLRKARMLLSEPARWTQDVMARDGADGPCGANSDNAVRWCIAGAISRCGGTTYGLASRIVAQIIGTEFASAFNDARGTTHADVIRVLCDAEARLRDE